jgi:hypothetical protein
MNAVGIIALPLRDVERLELAHREACQVVEDIAETIGSLYAERRPLSCRQRSLASRLQDAMRRAAATRDAIMQAMEDAR